VTNASKHIDALLAAFGEPPFDLPNVGCTVHAMAADGNTIRARVEWSPGVVEDWVVPAPEVLVVDPAGSIEIEQPVTNEDGEQTGTVTVRLREDPLAVAAAELASFLRVVRA